MRIARLGGVCVGLVGLTALTVGAPLLWVEPSRAQDGKTDPFGEKASGEDRWIHEDIEAGYAAAKESGKPLLVAFR